MFCSVTYDGDGNRVKSVIGTGTTLFVQFYRSSSGYQLRMRAYDSVLANYVNTPYVTITDAQHALEVDWGADGHATFWIDGVQQGSLTGLNNSTYRMDSIRLGAPYISGSLSGTYYLDAYESRRSSYIGPLAQVPSGSPPLAVVPNLVPVAYHPPASQPSQALTVADASPLLSTTNASFVYDGDGNRVAQTINGVTTYFIGGIYEVTGSTVTKYYFAGSQRVAMRTQTIPQNSSLYYFLSDHLGSTSITTDTNGAVVSELRYKAWGEVRYTSGTQQTKYQYTSQYSNMGDFGLMFYNARWYDPAIGRFAQADTIVPGGVQGLDRYAYVNNNPMRYTDPTGHKCTSEDGCDTPHGDLPSPFDIPSSKKEQVENSPYAVSFNRGVNFVNQLRSHSGWWSEYLNSKDPRVVWKFLLTLAYVFESYSYSTMPDWEDFKELMTDSIVNKVGDLYNQYGRAGFYIYIGGREALFKRGQHEGDDPRWEKGTPEYNNTWDLTWLGIQDTYEEATIEIENTWNLITSYNGTSYYGNASYDYGVTPPLLVDKSKVVWTSSKMIGFNSWTGKYGPYWVYFISK